MIPLQRLIDATSPLALGTLGDEAQEERGFVVPGRGAAAGGTGWPDELVAAGGLDGSGSVVVVGTVVAVSDAAAVGSRGTAVVRFGR